MPGNILSPVGPAPIYVEQGDQLTLNLTAPWPLIGTGLGNGQGGNVTGTYVISIRMTLASGQKYESQQIPIAISLTSGAGNPNYFLVQDPNFGNLPEGWLEAVSICWQAGNAQAGFVYAQVFLGKGTYVNSGALATQFSGTIPNYQPYCLIARAMPGNYTFTWPGSTPMAGIDGPGSIINIQPANPAAGANLSYTFPAAFRYQILNVFFQLATSSQAGNRYAQINFVKNLKTLLTSSASTAQAANFTSLYNYMPGVGPSSATTSTAIQEQIIPLPGTIVLDCAADASSNIMNTNIYNLQTGDQISNVNIRAFVWNEIS